MPPQLKVGLKVLNVSKFETYIASEIGDRIDSHLRSNLALIEKRVRQVVDIALTDSPEVKAMIAGPLNAELGFYKGSEASFVRPIIDYCVNNTTVELKRTGYINPNGSKAGKLIANIKVTLWDGDIARIVGLPTASYLSRTTTQGIVHETPIEWLSWMLEEGDRIIVEGWVLSNDLGPRQIFRSRSREALMVRQPGGDWRVPPAYAGDPTNNFITRAMDRCEDPIRDLFRSLVLNVR